MSESQEGGLPWFYDNHSTLPTDDAVHFGESLLQVIR